MSVSPRASSYTTPRSAGNLQTPRMSMGGGAFSERPAFSARHSKAAWQTVVLPDFTALSEALNGLGATR